MQRPMNGAPDAGDTHRPSLVSPLGTPCISPQPKHFEPFEAVASRAPAAPPVAPHHDPRRRSGGSALVDFSASTASHSANISASQNAPPHARTPHGASSSFLGASYGVPSASCSTHALSAVTGVATPSSVATAPSPVVSTPSPSGGRIPRVVHAADPHDELVLHVVPRAAVSHWPADVAARRAPARLCPAFAATAVCPAAERCPFVHAAAGLTQRLVAHVGRHAAPDALPPCDPLPVEAAASQARPASAAERLVAIALPNAAGPFESVRAGDCLATRGLERALAGERALAHCVHFLARGLCRLGEACRFAHVAAPSRAALAAVSEPPTAVQEPSAEGPLAVDSPAPNQPDEVVAGTGPSSRPTLRSSCAASTPQSAGTRSGRGTPQPRVFPFTHSPYQAQPRA